LDADQRHSVGGVAGGAGFRAADPCRQILWRGQDVFRSADLERWEPAGHILDVSGSREDDGGFGYHADVVVSGGEAYIFCFTHPGRAVAGAAGREGYEQRRSSIQAARLDVRAGRLVCDRDEAFELKLLAE